MEKFPTSDNPENINQEPAGADVLADMPSFEEARRKNAIPEGVRDEQDYREYQAEQQARSDEQDKADAEFIEHSNRYIAEISKIENSQDRYIAIASLRYMTDARKNKSRQSNTENAQDVMLEFFDRNDKDETIRSFIANKVNGLRENGASEEEINHYNLPNEYTEYIEKIEKGAKIQVINDTEETVEWIKEFDKQVRRGAVDYDLVIFGWWKHTEERPDSDRGIIVSMADELGDECYRLARIEFDNDNYNDDDGFATQDRARDYRDFAINKLMCLANYYTFGESFDHRTDYVKESFYREVMKCMESRADYITRGVSPEDVNYHRAMNMMAVMQVKDEFDEQKKNYESFQEQLAEGQQILDGFQKNSGA